MNRRRRLAMLMAGVIGWILAAGCSSKSTFEFDDLDLVPTHEELTEFSLGRFAIPIPIAAEEIGDEPVGGNRVQFDFELYAVVKRDEQSRIVDAWKRHQGKIRDRVIRACRSASMDDLQELKAHLMNAVQTQLGDKEVRQLVIAEVKSRQL